MSLINKQGQRWCKMLPAIILNSFERKISASDDSDALTDPGTLNCL
jgi:hypothetical protein